MTIFSKYQSSFSLDLLLQYFKKYLHTLKSPSCHLKQHFPFSTVIKLWPFVSSPSISEPRLCNLQFHLNPTGFSLTTLMANVITTFLIMIAKREKKISQNNEDFGLQCVNFFIVLGKTQHKQEAQLQLPFLYLLPP